MPMEKKTIKRADKLKAYLKRWGIVLAYALNFLWISAFMHAYFSPQKFTVVTINARGEATFEFVLITFVIIPLFMYSFYYIVIKNEPAMKGTKLRPWVTKIKGWVFKDEKV